MPIDFPPNPSIGLTYSYGGILWTYNGTAWDKTTSGSISTYVATLNGLSGGVNVAGGTSISVTPTGNTLTIAYTGTGFTGYDYEIHVSEVDGNDTTGNGDLLTPVASIIKALNLVGSQRKTIIVHPGTYNESPSITVQYTTITGPGLIGGNIVINGTVSTNTGCTISGIKMRNLNVATSNGAGNVNILNCEVSETFTKSSNADYTVLRLCDLTSASITGEGLVAIFGGNPNLITVNNASANVIVKSAVTFAPVLTAGKLSIVDCVVGATATNAVTSAPSSVITLANSQLLTSGLTYVAPVVLNGFYSILNCVYNKPTSTLAALSATGGSYNSIDYFQYINADKFITQGGTSTQFVKGDGSLDSNAVTSFNGLTGAVTGVTTGTANTFVVLQSFTSGISASGGVTLAGTLQGTTANFTGLVSSTVGFSGSGTNLNNIVKTINGLSGAIGLTNGNGIGISVSGNTLTFSNTGVLSFNGLTGAVTGVASIRGLTGAVGISAGSNITISASGNTLTISAAVLIGATGATGSQGIQGNIGTTGAGYLSLSGQEIEMGSLSVGDSYIILVSATPQPAYSIGQSLIVYDTSVPNSNRYFTGTITDWASASNIVTLTITKIVGSATSTSWILNLVGQEGPQGNTGATGPVGPYVISFNGFTGAVSGVTTGTANTFGPLQSFTSGISAAGGVTFTGTFSGATGSFSRLLTASAGISAAGGVTFAGTVSSDTGYRISSSPFNTQTGTTYTFVAADNGKIVTFNNGSTITVTVPTGLPVGFNCTGIQLGAGQIGFTAASGVTLNAYASGLKIAGQHGSAALISYTSNVYNLSGTLTI
jgi:hypothetical protein